MKNQREARITETWQEGEKVVRRSVREKDGS